MIWRKTPEWERLVWQSIGIVNLARVRLVDPQFYASTDGCTVFVEFGGGYSYRQNRLIFCSRCICFGSSREGISAKYSSRGPPFVVNIMAPFAGRQSESP